LLVVRIGWAQSQRHDARIQTLLNSFLSSDEHKLGLWFRVQVITLTIKELTPDELTFAQRTQTSVVKGTHVTASVPAP
jgi:hypothetical protein